MALVLVGQNELWDKLNLKRYAAVRQRIDINCILEHLDRAETQKYVQTHLVYAQGKTDIFTDAALDQIFKDSTGIPRRINRICEKGLMYAFQQNKRLIDDHMIRFVMDHEMLNKRMDPSTWEGSIDYIYDKGFYECGVTSRGSTFRLMIGKHKDGNFLCIPNWSVGIELSKLKDRFWNYERLTQYGRMGNVGAHSVADALAALDKYIKL